MGLPDHLTCLLRNLHAGPEEQLKPHMEQWTGSQLGKECVKAVCCHPAYLTYMQSTSCEMPGWKTAGKNNNFRYADDTTVMAESE